MSVYENLANIIYSSINRTRSLPEYYTALIAIPIKTIDNVLCDVRLKHNLSSGIWITIESKNDYLQDYDEATERLPFILYDGKCQKFNDKDNITINEIETILSEQFEILSKLKFSVFNGKFLVKKFETSDETTWGFLRKFESITLEFDECCVCNEITLSKTIICNHSICRPCMFKLKEIKDEDCDCSNQHCPICREIL